MKLLDLIWGLVNPPQPGYDLMLGYIINIGQEIKQLRYLLGVVFSTESREIKIGEAVDVKGHQPATITLQQNDIFNFYSFAFWS